MRVEFGELKKIIKDKTSKNKLAKDSSVCLSEFIASVNNYVEHSHSLKQDEMANVTMSVQNWVLRRGYTSFNKGTVDIGDIFYADLGLNYKPEYSYHHPVIVLEKVGNRVMVVPVSTSKDNIDEAYHPIDNLEGSKFLRKVYGDECGAESDGFERTGAILLTDIKIISQDRLIEKKGALKDISNKDSLFQEIKYKVFTYAFPKQNIELFKTKRDYEHLKEEHEKLLVEYNILIEKVKQYESSTDDSEVQK